MVRDTSPVQPAGPGPLDMALRGVQAYNGALCAKGAKSERLHPKHICNKPVHVHVHVHVPPPPFPDAAESSSRFAALLLPPPPFAADAISCAICHRRRFSPPP